MDWRYSSSGPYVRRPSRSPPRSRKRSSHPPPSPIRRRSLSYSPVPVRRRTSLSPIRRGSRPLSRSPMRYRSRPPSRSPVRRNSRHPSRPPIRRRSSRPPSRSPIRCSSRPPSRPPVRRSSRPPSRSPIRCSSRPPSRPPIRRSSRPPSFSPIRRSSRPPSRSPIRCSSRHPSRPPIRRRSRPPSRSPIRRRSGPPSLSPIRRSSRPPSRSPIRRRSRPPSRSPIRRRSRPPSRSVSRPRRALSRSVSRSQNRRLASPDPSKRRRFSRSPNFGERSGLSHSSHHRSPGVAGPGIHPDRLAMIQGGPSKPALKRRRKRTSPSASPFRTARLEASISPNPVPLVEPSSSLRPSGPGIHPDRLVMISGSSATSSQPTTSSGHGRRSIGSKLSVLPALKSSPASYTPSNRTTGIHPDRLKMIETAERREPHSQDNLQDLPDVYSILSAKVESIRDFGAFVSLDDFKMQALLHISQLSQQHVEKVSDVLDVGEHLYVKVIEIKRDDNGRTKVAVSIKYVNQTTGQDTDPNQVDLSLMQQRHRKLNSNSQSLRLDAVLDTTCARCGGSGHTKEECYTPDGSHYDLIDENELILSPLESQSEKSSKRRSHRHKRRHKRNKKSKKREQKMYETRT